MALGPMVDSEESQRAADGKRDRTRTALGRYYKKLVRQVLPMPFKYGVKSVGVRRIFSRG